MKRLLLTLLFIVAASPSHAFEGYHKWVGIFAKESGIRKQKLITALQYKPLVAKIKPLDAKGFYLSDLKYGDGRWLAVMSKGEAIFSERIVSDGRWGNFREKMKNPGKRVSNAEADF